MTSEDTINCEIFQNTSTLFMQVSDHATLCILPDIELCDEIQEIRSQHDTSFDRWPPHINLCWPFIKSNNVYKLVQSVIEDPAWQTLQPFTITLQQFVFSKGSKYISLPVEEADACAPVISYLTKTFPEAMKANTRTGAPHLSVGQFDQTTIAKTTSALQAKFTPVTFQVDRLYILSRNSTNSPFKVVGELPFLIPE